MNRVELLRDLYLWAYERSTKEYLAVKQELIKPDQQRLQYRERVKNIIKKVILSPESLPQDVIETSLEDETNAIDKTNISALVLEELRRIHEGVLARYNLRPSQLERWRNAQA